MDRITDYDSLVTAVVDLVDLAIGDSIDGYIQLTENDIGRQLDTNWQEFTLSTPALMAGIALTDDKRGVLRVRIGDVPLEYLHRDVAENQYRDWPAGVPQAYSVTGGNVSAPAQQFMEFWPLPPDDISHVADITYKLAVPALTAGAPTNWVLSVAPDVYLYGTAQHAVIFNGDATSAKAYVGAYQQAVAGVLAEAERYHQSQRTTSPPGAGGYEFWLP